MPDDLFAEFSGAGSTPKPFEVPKPPPTATERLRTPPKPAVAATAPAPAPKPAVIPPKVAKQPHTPEEQSDWDIGGFIGGLGKSFGHVAMEGIRGQGAAGEQLVHDIVTPEYKRPLHEQVADQAVPFGRIAGDIMGVAGGGAVGGIAKATIGEPVAAAVNPTVRKVTKAAFGDEYEVDPQRLGDLVTLALPFVGEANEARAAAKFAKEAGISENMALKVMAEARAQTPKTAAAAFDHTRSARARRGAALDLIHQPDIGQRVLMGRGAGDLKADETLEASRKFTESGAGEPTLQDVLPRRGPAARLIRAAGVKMPAAQKILESYQARLRESAPRRGRDRTLEDAPNPKVSVKKRIETLENEKNTRASSLFRPAYRTPVKTDEHLVNTLFNFPEWKQVLASALKDLRGRATNYSKDDPESIENAMEARQHIRELHGVQAYHEALDQYHAEHKEWEQNFGGKFEKEPSEAARKIIKDPKSDPQVVQDLKWEYGWEETPEPVKPEPPTMSGGSIDRVRRITRNFGDALMGTRERSRGSSLMGRAARLDEYLDNVPHLEEARADYRDYSSRIEALKFKENIGKMLPRQFKEYLDTLSPAQKAELTNNILEKYAEGAGTSSHKFQAEEDTIETGPNTRDNLIELLGEDKAKRLMDALDMLGGALDNANDSTKGSQTAYIENDTQEAVARMTIAALVGHTRAMVFHGARLIRRWMDHVPKESAEVLAKWATGNPDAKGNPTMTLKETLEDIFDAVQANEDGSLRSFKAPRPNRPAANFPPEVAAILAQASLRNTPLQTQEEGQEQQGKDPAAATPASPAPYDPNTDLFKDFSDTSAPANTNDIGGDVKAQAASATGLQGDDLQAALDVMGIESGGAPGKLDTAAYNPAGGGQGASGIAQWRGDRQQGEGSTLAEQLQHVGNELNSLRFAGVREALAAAQTMPDKWDVWLTQYEGLERGGPDYMNDLTRLMGVNAARAYVESKGGVVTGKRRGQGGQSVAASDGGSSGVDAYIAPPVNFQSQIGSIVGAQ